MGCANGVKSERPSKPLNNHEKLTARVYQIEDWSRKPFSKSTVRTFFLVVEKFYNGKCPCCGEVQILNRLGGKAGNLELDHFKGAKWNKITEGWPVCKVCHSKLTHGYLSCDGGWVLQAFQGFQMRVAQHQANGKNKDQRLLFKQ